MLKNDNPSRRQVGDLRKNSPDVPRRRRVPGRGQRASDRIRFQRRGLARERAARLEGFPVSIRVRAATGPARGWNHPCYCYKVLRTGRAQVGDLRKNSPDVPRRRRVPGRGQRASDRIRFQRRGLARERAARLDGFPVSIRVRAATGPARGSNHPCYCYKVLRTRIADIAIIK